MILELNLTISIDQQLKFYLRNLGVETSFQAMNLDNNHRKLLSKMVNFERMTNNPIAFSQKEINYIFEL